MMAAPCHGSRTVADAALLAALRTDVLSLNPLCLSCSFLCLKELVVSLYLSFLVPVILASLVGSFLIFQNWFSPVQLLLELFYLGSLMIVIAV